MSRIKNRVSQTLRISFAVVILLTGISFFVTVASGLSHGKIVAVKTKGSTGRDILIVKSQDPSMYWGNVVIHFFSGVTISAFGIFCLIKIHSDAKTISPPKPTSPKR
ncbi:hypothetical protein [Nibricoccus aquaticus]|uniref:hypothetical protein n=1 Tax=Nibricoccus aquaticus TaxID=2576891 RepID=UPI0010FD7C89|nr:hypothetical protein [Nibricoccus aquaticus]